VLGRVQGGAYGGGIGFMCCCDAVICADNAQFSLSEVRLGLTPSTISPYVLGKIGSTHARDLFLSAARFGATQALRIGLVHQVVPEAELDEAIDARVQQYLSCAPGAVAAAKAQIAALGPSPAQWREETARLIAGLRSSAEGREGLASFLEKRKPGWAE
jgi:methylglutaconyl-CoA hydratase